MSNTTLNALVVDDEQDARDILKYYLADLPQIGTITEASNAEEAIFKYIETKPDIVFLDIMMPGKTGMEIVEILKKQDSTARIIIVSGHRDSALPAIQNNVYDFILKPIDFALLAEKVENCHSLFRSKPEEKVREIINNQDQSGLVKISSTNNFILINPAEVVYCEADGSYTYFYLDNGVRELANSYLGKVVRYLPEPKFFRISRSTLINIEKLIQVDKTNNTCTLRGGEFEIILTGTRRQIRILCEMDLD